MGLVHKMRTSLLCASAASFAAVPSIFATGTVDEDAIISEIIGIITKIAGYIGLFLLVWSVVMLVLALKNEDADSKSRAVMLIAVSIALILLGTLLEPILKAVGY